VTARAFAIFVGSAGLAALGWGLRWPELTGLGAAGVALVVAVVLLYARRPRATLSSDRVSVRTGRDHPMTVALGVVAPRRRRSLRLVVGDPAAPAATLPLAAARERDVVSVPVDTSRRGQFELGPYRLVHGDPWGLVRRVVADVSGGIVLVHPRVRHLRRGAFAIALQSESESVSRRQGQDHFHALRDYVLGDEPRNVHWRSSASAGKLMVRQQVAAASSGTAVVLDTDATAYGSDTAFGSGWDADRFEDAVDVAASVAMAQTSSAEKVHVLTTTRGAGWVTAESGSAGALLDALAVTSAVPPLDSAPEELSRVLRRVRCSRIVIVTGTPSQSTLRAATTLSHLASTTVVRVRPALPKPAGLRVIDVESVDELG
jgi:uncharacterized protein (DUF58 family)